MRIAILQSNYIPWKGYFDLIDYVDKFVLYDCVQYTKNDWRNRNRIVVQGNPSWLTIPVTQSTLDQRIDETKVASTGWAKKHWRTLQQSYAKRPGFAHYQKDAESCYETLGHLPLLSDVNETLIRFACQKLEISTEIINSNLFDLPEDRVARLVHICQKLGATEYVSGPAAKSYLAEEQFTEVGIDVGWFEYSGYQAYPQNTEDFTHEVSILDLLFNTGPDAPNYFKGERS